MKNVDFLIIGGSAAGTTAAEVIRGLKPQTSITIVTDELHEEYSRVLLPHYIRGKVHRDQVILKNPNWYLEKNIGLLKGSRVKSLKTDAKIAILVNDEEIKYGKVLIAIGGYVIKLQVPNSKLQNILYMRTLEDADAIVKASKQAKKAVIIGGGFIGLEFASCFKVNGVNEIVVLVREPYYWAGKLDEASSKVLVRVLERNGVKVLTGEEVDRIEPGRGQSLPQTVITKSGKKFDADVVGVGIGIKSDLSFLAGSGVKIDRGIVANEYLETNVADVYAVGDCAQFKDVIFEREHIVGNWANATSQGNAVGRTMAGVRTVFETASSYSINFFDPSTHSKISGQASSGPGGSCSFIGVTDEKFADKIIVRGSVEEGKMARIFIKEYPSTHSINSGQASSGSTTRIVGATIINDPSEVSPISAAVRSKTDVSAHVDKLSDLNFDLKEIVQI